MFCSVLCVCLSGLWPPKVLSSFPGALTPHPQLSAPICRAPKLFPLKSCLFWLYLHNPPQILSVKHRSWSELEIVPHWLGRKWKHPTSPPCPAPWPMSKQLTILPNYLPVLQVAQISWNCGPSWKTIWQKWCQSEKDIDRDSGSGGAHPKVLPWRDPGSKCWRFSSCWEVLRARLGNILFTQNFHESFYLSCVTSGEPEENWVLSVGQVPEGVLPDAWVFVYTIHLMLI